jgi:ArsR family transcriptional regulator
MKIRSRLPQPQTKTIFRALSDRTRLRILNLLGDGELCVCHLVAVLDVPQPTASRHLAYLRKAGLVVARKEGLWMHYRLAPARSKFRELLLECLRQCYREETVFAKDDEKLRLRVRSGCPG